MVILSSPLSSVRRSPRGERGLKSIDYDLKPSDFASLPSRGAWIEISHSLSSSKTPIGSLPSRGAWIEISRSRAQAVVQTRRSPRGGRGLK